ncbi:MAG: PASTA domain-containing protein [Oscillospiraceae bacterium]|nr:PASTA domain-containing protein [Oscillospiraceae bacterium]
MKKMDLYRSIDGIKPDDCLKEQILKAAEENDVVTVIKRPVFVPVMIALLLCLNVGMVAKLVIFNKSQVNMSEFKARTSMSSAADIDSDMNELQKELEAQEAEKQLEEEEKLKMQQELEAANREKQAMEFEAAKAEFLEFLESEKSHVYTEMEILGDYVYLQGMTPAYLLDDTAYQESENNNYRRYVYVVDYTAKSDNEFTEVDFAMTNYEFIIGYDGEGVEPDNIVSITKSKAEFENVTEDMIQSALERVNSDESKEKIIALGQQKIDEFEKAGESESDYTISNCYCLFKNSQDSPQIVFEIIESVLCYDGNWENIEFYVDENGEDVTYSVEHSSRSYWNETVYSPYKGYPKTVIVPDVTGMSVQEAQEAIEAAGLKVSSRYYEAPTDIDFEFNNVFETYPQPGTAVASGTDVELRVYARMMPALYNYPLDSAKEILEKMGLKVKLEYVEGVDPDSNDLYVSHFSPYQYTAVEEGEEVTLYIANPDTTNVADLIGCAINLDENSFDYRKIYTAEETQEVLADFEKYDIEGSLYLGTYGYYNYNDVVFYGKYYGKYFLFEAFSSNSEYTNSVPLLHCGSEELDISECVKSDVYSKLNAEVSDIAGNKKISTENPADGSPDTFILEANYMLSYTSEDGREIKAYFDTENGYIVSIYVTDKEVYFYEN